MQPDGTLSVANTVRANAGIVDSPTRPGLTWTGLVFGVSWIEDSAIPGAESSAISLARLDALGVTLGAGSISGRIPYQAARQTELAWLSGLGEFGAFWVGTTMGLLFEHANSAGAHIGGQVVAASGGYDFAPVARPDLGQYTMARSTPTSDLFIDHIDASGMAVRVSRNLGQGVFPAIAWSGTEYGLLKKSPGDNSLTFVRLDQGGLPIPPELPLSPSYGSADSTSLLWTGDHWVATWDKQTAPGETDVFLAQISRQGQLIGTIVQATTATGESANPQIAWGGSILLLVWQDARDQNREIYSSRWSCR
jgi:hypothetical protein